MLSKVLDISSATVRVPPDLLKALAILSDTAARRYAADRDQNHTGNQKKSLHLSFLFNKAIIYKFFKDFTNHRKNTNRVLLFACKQKFLAAVFCL